MTVSIAVLPEEKCHLSRSEATGLGGKHPLTAAPQDRQTDSSAPCVSPRVLEKTATSHTTPQRPFCEGACARCHSERSALGWRLGGLEHRPGHQKVAGSIPGRAPIWAVGSISSWGVYGRPVTHVSLSQRCFSINFHFSNGSLVCHESPNNTIWPPIMN